MESRIEVMGKKENNRNGCMDIEGEGLKENRDGLKGFEVEIDEEKGMKRKVMSIKGEEKVEKDKNVLSSNIRDN